MCDFWVSPLSLLCWTLSWECGHILTREWLVSIWVLIFLRMQWSHIKFWKLDENIFHISCSSSNRLGCFTRWYDGQRARLACRHLSRAWLCHIYPTLTCQSVSKANLYSRCKGKGDLLIGTTHPITRKGRTYRHFSSPALSGIKSNWDVRNWRQGVKMII